MKKGTRVDSGRRLALKLGAIAGIGCVAPALGRAAGASRSDDSYDVIVVGAGMAGMQAARVLLQHGYRVVVLEATDRHGGRIYSRTLGNTRIEMGAEEYYLAKNNPIYEAVVDELGADAYTRAYVGEQLISMDGGKACWEETGACEDDPDIQNWWKYWSHYGIRSKHKDFSLSMADDVLAHYGVGRGHRAYHLYDSGIAGSIYGASLSRVGAASLAEQDWKWTLSEDIRVLAWHDIGYLDALNRTWWNVMLEHVRLNSAVTSIDTSGDHVVVEDITGKRHYARKVVVTASIGVLQSETIDFNPALPDSTIEAYRNIGMGRGMKVALRFSEQFWESRMSYLITEGLSSSCWIPTSYKRGTGDRIVMCYPMGDNGKALTDVARAAGGGAGGDDAIIKVMLSDLDLLFDQRASASYIDGIVQDWTADPYVRGSYSYPMSATYAPDALSKRMQLASPIANTIFFASEATNNQNPSCVPGALQEGERAARAIHALLNGVSNPPSVSA